MTTPHTDVPKCCEKCDAQNGAFCAYSKCPCHTTSSDWKKKFLNAGTEKGCGDLSLMVGIVSEIIRTEIAKARREERERIAKVVNELMPILYSEDAERHASNIRLTNNLNIILQALTNKES